MTLKQGTEFILQRADLFANGKGLFETFDRMFPEGFGLRHAKRSKPPQQLESIPDQSARENSRMIEKGLLAAERDFSDFRRAVKTDGIWNIHGNAAGTKVGK